MWFPRPAGSGDIVLLRGSSAPSKGELAALLSDPAAEEWRGKVGVVGGAEGSAKPTARLLCAQGWVLKTNLDQACSDLASAARWVAHAADQASRFPLWHPSKAWLVVRVGAVFHPMSACPRLPVVRAVQGFTERVEAWGRMGAWALEISRRFDVGMDVHPSNFGEEDGRLYYLDDELYEGASARSIGAFVAGRIPEEEALPGEWERAGRRLAQHLSAALGSKSEWRELEEGLADYPLLDRYDAARDAVRAGLRSIAYPRASRRARAEPRLTCVLADVHANLPALEAVLREARALGADDHLFLGDAVGYGPHPRECVEALARLSPLSAIRGNHDHAALLGRAHEGMNGMARTATQWTAAQLGEREREWLASLPLEASGPGWLAVHGAPRDPERFHAYVYELTYRENLQALCDRELALCFCGHTHVPFVHRRAATGQSEKLGASAVVVEPGACVIVNPGSVGQPRDGDSRASFALWDRASGQVSFHRVEYALERTLEDLARSGLPRDLAHRLELGR